jgi:hypothetical protein
MPEMFREIFIADEGVPLGAGGIRQHIPATGIPFDAPSDCHLFPVFYLDSRLGLGLNRLSGETGRTYCGKQNVALMSFMRSSSKGACHQRACPSLRLKILLIG